MDPDRKDDDSTLFSTKYLSSLFTFLTTPESYLLSAGLLSSLPAAFFVLLNVLALSCVISQCSALDDSSNTISSWIIFESISLFFFVTSGVSLVAYFRIRRSRRGR